MLEIDASGIGVGVVLRLIPKMQKKKKIAYTRELFAIIITLAKFRHYLLGQKLVMIFELNTSQGRIMSQLMLSLECSLWPSQNHSFN